jgi:hypothetical protein
MRRQVGEVVGGWRWRWRVREFVDVGVRAALHQSQGVGPTFRRAVSRRAGTDLFFPNSAVDGEIQRGEHGGYASRDRSGVCAWFMEMHSITSKSSLYTVRERRPSSPCHLSSSLLSTKVPSSTAQPTTIGLRISEHPSSWPVCMLTPPW